jgi:hypothetical protein
MSRAEATGDRVLALQVLQQALADASAEPTVRGKARTYTRPIPEEQEEARRFLTARTGGWAEARARWCAMAGIEAEYLALRVAKMAVGWANSARRARLDLPPT